MGVYISPFPRPHPLPNLLAPHALPVPLTVVPTAPRPAHISSATRAPSPPHPTRLRRRGHPAVSGEPLPTPPPPPVSWPRRAPGVRARLVGGAGRSQPQSRNRFRLVPVLAGFLGPLVAGAGMEPVGARRSPGSRRRGAVSLRGSL
ncbi:hypothetical protein VPH35_023457 [Triticum aestivum]